MAIFPTVEGGIGIAAQASEGTAEAAADGWLQAKAGANIGKQQGIDQPDALTVTRLQTRTRGKWVAGSFSFIPNYAANTGMASLLEHVFGEATGADPITYGIKDPSDEAILTVFKDLGGYVERFADCKVNAIEFVFAQGFAECSVEIIGKSVDHPAAATITLDDDSTLIHSNDVDVFTIGGTDYSAAIREFRCRMEVPHTGEERMFLGATEIATPLRSGPRVVTCQALLEMRDATPDTVAEFELFEANTNLGDIVFKVTSGNVSNQFTVGSVQAVGDPITTDGGPAMWNLNGEGNDLTLVRDTNAGA